MKRTHLTLVAVAGLAAVSLTACASSVTGSGSGTSSPSSVVTTLESVPAGGSDSVSALPSASASIVGTPVATTPAHVAPVTTAKAPIATPSPLPVFNDLRLSYKACAPVVSQSPTDISLIWSVVNATGIAVGIDDTNFADATQYSKTSGNMVVTSGSCTSGEKYTIDVWTLGGTGGKQAHKQLVYTAPKYP